MLVVEAAPRFSIRSEMIPSISQRMAPLALSGVVYSAGDSDHRRGGLNREPLAKF